MRICDYSSLIFTGNTTVLLIVALTTDYWEYRNFDRERILKMITESGGTKIILPFDTDSYFQIKVKSNSTSVETEPRKINLVKYEAFYHGPLFLIRRFYQHLDENVTQMEELELNLFEEYGNLFRDCDSLEVAVRIRIGLTHKRPNKCVYFHDASKSSDIHVNAPQLNYLEGMASTCAMMCIISICITLVAGAHGLFVRYSSFRTFHIASCASLVAGFFLTIGIALFHGKCHILRKMEFFPGHNLPYKNILQRHRIYSYGWSFVLAWICVFFSYTSAYVWLSKAQRSQPKIETGDMKLYSVRSTAEIHSSIFINFLKYRNNICNRHEIATV